MKNLPHWLFLSIASVLALVGCTGVSNDTWAGVSGDTGEDTVVVSYKDTVVSLRADKSRRWSYEGDGEADFFAPALLTPSHVFVGDFDGRLHAIRRESGTGDWVFEPERESLLGIFDFGVSDRIIAAIGMATADLLFVGDEYGVYALEVQDGEPRQIWEFETDHSVWAQPLYVNDPELGPPTLIVASLDKHLYALNPETGDARWSIDLDGALVDRPTLDPNHQRLYVGTLNSELYAINFEDGALVDTFQAEGWIWSSPIIVDDHLYFGDLQGRLYEVEVTADGFGEESWHQQIADGAFRAAPLVVDDILLLASEDRKVYALNLADKSRKWENDIDAEAVTDITWVTDEEGNPLVVVGTKDEDRLLVALRLTDGSEAWRYERD